MPNSNPTIERMMQIFEVIESAGDAVSQATLVERTGLARSTVYRLLNSLTECGMLREVSAGRFAFGGRLLQLAENVTPGSDFISRLRFLQPTLDKLALDIGQTCKISVLERGAIMVVAGASARTPHAMSYTVGEYLPLHAGGASKVLMAYLDRAQRQRLLGSNRPSLTERTIVNMDEFEHAMRLIEEREWAEDTGEYSLSVCSYAAPIRGKDGDVIAALSVPFMSGTSHDDREAILNGTILGARKLSDEYGRFT